MSPRPQRYRLFTFHEVWGGNRWKRRRNWQWLWATLGLAAILAAFAAVTYYINMH